MCKTTCRPIFPLVAALLYLGLPVTLINMSERESRHKYGCMGLSSLLRRPIEPV